MIGEQIAAKGIGRTIWTYSFDFLIFFLMRVEFYCGTTRGQLLFRGGEA